MQHRGEPVVVKKYSNRRLYDTNESRYVTLEELARTIQNGVDVRVVDAKTHADLTQQTLTQIILENRKASRLLPVGLLFQLIRMQDDDLAEFFGKYMSWAMDLYYQAKRGAQAMTPFNPFASLPFNAANGFARMFTQSEPPPPPPPEVSSEQEQIADLRKELEAIKEAILKKD